MSGKVLQLSQNGDVYKNGHFPINDLYFIGRIQENGTFLRSGEGKNQRSLQGRFYKELIKLKPRVLITADGRIFCDNSRGESVDVDYFLINQFSKVSATFRERFNRLYSEYQRN